LAASTQTLQTAIPALGTVSRLPQTTAQGAGADAGNVPFPRLSKQSQILGPQIAGVAFGTLQSPIVKAVGGYLRHIWLTVTAAGGNGGTTAAVASADAPYNTIQLFVFRDPFGQPIILSDGWGIHLINMYSGQTGMLGFGNLESALPSWSAINTGGNFNWSTLVPLELDSSGYGSLPMMNASSQPQLQIQLNPAGTVFTTQPVPTVPTLTIQADEPFWIAPVDAPGMAPADVGSSGQWTMVKAQGLVGSAAFQRIILPRVGTFCHTLILQLRDSTFARIDQWPANDLTLYVDGVPLLTESFNQRADNMYRQFGVARPTGCIVYTFRNSVQTAVSNADTYDLLLPTTPATLLEIGGTFGTISNAPAQIICYIGEVFPVGGIPYAHLAQ